MPQEILVVEYEPRYMDRIRQALEGQPFTPVFARDGEEAVRLVRDLDPRLIVVSSVIPKVRTPDLIRSLRDRSAEAPILITVSGYNGKNPKGDAGRFGAQDLLPKPYSESDFLAKVHQMLGGGSAPPLPEPAPAEEQLTSDEIFGDLLEGEDDVAPAAPPSRADAKSKASTDLDALLESTLSGVRTPKKREGERRSSTADLDKLLETTLSGIERSGRSRSPETDRAVPEEKPSVPEPAPPAAEEVPRPSEVEEPGPVAEPPSETADRIHVSSPVLAEREPATEPHASSAVDESAGDDDDGQRFGQYLLTERIATGGMAEVWKARMRGVEGFEKLVAIKKILPHLSDNEEFVTMFIDEAKLAAQLNHNNIIHIYDLGKIGQSYYIAMEYIDGADLKSILRRASERYHPLPVELALFVGSKLASALAYAHRKRDLNDQEMGLVHRDVSPQNVLISHEGDIKLCDFGIAKAASKASHTQAGALKGKLQYMSPEQAWGRAIDRRSDIFALGTVLYELLVGKKLFAGDSEISILEQVREARVAVPSDSNDEVPPEVDAIVERALAKDPADRYQTAADMQKDIDAVLYNYKPTPTSADLAIYMHRLFTDAPEVVAPMPGDGGMHDMTPAYADDEDAISIDPTPDQAAAARAAATAVTTPPAPAPAPVPPAVVDEPAPEVSLEEDDEGRSKLLPIAIGLALLLLIGGAAGYFITSGGDEEAPAGVAGQTVAPAGTDAPPMEGIPADTSAELQASVPPTAADPAAIGQADQAFIDEQVRRRIEEERRRLEQQRAAEIARTSQADRPASPARPAPAARQEDDEPARQAAREPEPEPVRTATSAPAPVQPAPVATTVETRPEPPPQRQEPVQPRVREGDLVEVGTPGLVAPELIGYDKPPYPRLARMQKVEGIVVLSVLVSEAGRVLDVKMLRGVPQQVGINEAAIEAIRNSGRFRPATKDGVKVKSWKTITIPFKL